MSIETTKNPPKMYVLCNKLNCLYLQDVFLRMYISFVYMLLNLHCQ